MRRILLALAAACVASGLTVAAVLVLADGRDTERAIEHRALAAARNGAHAAERELAAALARLEGLATSPALRDRDLRGMHEQMLAARTPPGTWLVLFDRERQLVNTLRPFGSSLPCLADYDAATQAEWAAFLEGGEPQLSNLNPAPVAGGRAVSVLLPIKEEGRVVHVLNTILNSDRLAAVLAATQSLPPGWGGALIDRRGTVAARSGSTGPAVGGPATEAVLAEIGARAALDGVLSGPGLVGEPALIAFARIGDTGWFAAAEVPSAVARAPTRRALVLVVGAGLALLLGGGGLAVLLARRIERPFALVSGLLAAARRRQRAAEDRHRTHWEHTGEGLFAVSVTPDGRFVLDGLNPAHEELTGLRSADVAGREMGEFLPPDVAAAVSANYRRCVEAGAPIRYDETLDLPGGRRDWETVLAPVRDPETGRVALILGSAREVTERRRAEAALRESDQRFRAIAEAMPGFVLTSAPGRGCDWVSPYFYEFTGLPPGAAEGAGWAAALHPEDAPRVLEAWRAAQAAGEPFEGEYRFRAADGSWRWFMVRKRPVHGEDGRVARWVGTGVDIDDLKRASGALDAANRRLEGILAGISDCYLTLDRDWRVTEINPQAAAWYGVERAAVLGRRYLELFPQAAGTSVERALRGVLEGRRTRHATTRSIYRPGRWVDNRLYPTAEGLSLFFSDATDRKRAEDALRAGEESRRLAQEAAGVGTWEYDLAAGGLRWSPEAHQLLGRAPEATPGDSRTAWHGVVHPEDRAEVQARFSDALARGTPFSVEFRRLHRGRGGEERWMAARGRLLGADPDADGTGGRRLAGVVIDITERRRAEAATRASNALLQGTLDALSAQVAILDTDGRVVSVNAAWRRFTAANGCADAGVGTDYLAACAAARPGCADADPIAEGLRAVMRGEGREFRHDYPCRCGGAPRWFQLRATRFGGGERRRIVVAHEDITEVKAAAEAVRDLAGRAMAAQDEERRRIARELHDSTAQNLLGASLAATCARNIAPDLPPEAGALLDDALSLVEQSQREIRTLSCLLHPPMLDEAGLGPALDWLRQGLARRSGLRISVEAPPAPARMPREVETALFRVAQEALANVHRHAGASSVLVRLTVAGRPRPEARLAVSDDGRGIGLALSETHGPDDSIRLGVGLMGMRERLRQLGGRLAVGPAPGGGTLVEASVPLNGDGLPPTDRLPMRPSRRADLPPMRVVPK